MRRAAVARAAGVLSTRDAQPYLDELVLDPLPFVGNVALESWPGTPPPRTSRGCAELDGQPDLGRRLTAAVVLGDNGGQPGRPAALGARDVR